MEIVEKDVNSIKILIPQGRIDTANSPGFESKILEIIENDNKKIIVDFSKVEFISSSGLRVLLMVAKKIKSINGKIILCGMEEDVQEVFEISGFDSIFIIMNDIEQSVNDF